ncbi:hypothetical protein FRC02_002857 [Tulasnella sp. 418]|nr:hypothetical protein FRC02_002857 [Tulasnella sp. 418]
MDNRVSIHNSSSNTPYTVFDSRRQPEADNNEPSSTSKLQKTVQSIVPGTLFNRLFMKDSTTRLHGSEVPPLNESSDQNRPTPQSAQGQSLDDRSSLKVPSLAAEILKDSRTKMSSQGSSARSSGEVSEIKGFHARLLRRKEGQVARRSSLSVASQASPGAQDYDSFSHQDCPPNGLDIFYTSSDNAVNMTGDSTIQPLNTHAMPHSSPAPGRSLLSGLQELQSSHEVEDSRLRQAHNFNSSSTTARTKSSLMIEAFQEMEMEKSRLLSQVEQLQDRICQLEQENAATTLHSRETKENAVKAVRAATEKR